MKARKINYLQGDVFYIYDDDLALVAVVTDGVIAWQDGDGSEPFKGANERVMELIK